ncbi:hypothetical protein [Lacinutrix sp.]|uniref:hypothetical protein n=1 Tax=Lacinutrix sp. TaxID=1937692 RepID=UPI0025C2B95C|nr:hypothetical protein [Lacinutrix sp.]
MRKRKKLTFKRVLKIITGVIIFFTLPTLLLYCFLYFKYNEDLPVGEETTQADILANKMLNALNYDAYKTTDYIEFTFKKRHHYKWNKTKNTCKVYWKNFKVNLDLNDLSKSEAFKNETKIEGEDTKKLIEKAISYFNNDTFWLVAPYKVFDEGVKRSIVTLENNEKSLLVSYTSGGSTPGDSYLWHLDIDGKPKSFKMWTSILPIQGLEATWSDWKTTETGAVLPTFHKMMILGLEIEGIKSSQLDYLKITCQEKEIQEEDSVLDPTIIRTCNYKNFTSVSEGNASYVGKYYWDYKLFETRNDSVIEIKNSEMFNSNSEELEQKLNVLIKEQYNSDLRIPELKNCMSQIKFRHYSLDEMGIMFKESKEVEFHLYYKLPSACDNVGSSIKRMKLSEIKKYLK